MFCNFFSAEEDSKARSSADLAYLSLSEDEQVHGDNRSGRWRGAVARVFK
jgi:hypothetical protein